MNQLGQSSACKYNTYIVDFLRHNFSIIILTSSSAIYGTDQKHRKANCRLPRSVDVFIINILRSRIQQEFLNTTQFWALQTIQWLISTYTNEWNVHPIINVTLHLIQK